jgi:aminodeoxyfutalosine synthase
MVNRHINPTNICRNRCKFCAFARSEGEEGAYEMTLDTVAEAAAEGAADGAYEIHIVSGLHPDWSYDFYLDMVRRTREAVPDHVIVQAFTAVEIEHMAIIGEKSTREVLADLKAVGLDALPGGGAEIFSDRTRMAAWDKKTKSDVWLRIHGEAHELGIATNCTMLYGHIETAEERVDHLIRLREQQDATGGFLAFIPLAFHPANTELADLPARPASTTSRRSRSARLMLDNIPHIKAFWIMVGLKIAQLATCFGVDDIDGTVVEERITHMAGATTPEALSKDDLVGMIAETGHVAVERDTLYRVVRIYDAEARVTRLGRRTHRHAPARRYGVASGTVATGETDVARPRLGHIQFINCLPLYYGHREERRAARRRPREGRPARSRAMLLAGELDVAPIPAIEYARHADELVLLPDIAISSDGEVQSILLLSKVPPNELGGRTVALTDTSRTSQVLARVLLERHWGAAATYVEMPPDLPACCATPTPRCSSATRRCAPTGSRPGLFVLRPRCRVDRWTGLAHGLRRLGGAPRSTPTSSPLRVQAVADALSGSLAYCRQHLDDISEYAARWEPSPPSVSAATSTRCSSASNRATAKGLLRYLPRPTPSASSTGCPTRRSSGRTVSDTGDDTALARARLAAAAARRG